MKKWQGDKDGFSRKEKKKKKKLAKGVARKAAQIPEAYEDKGKS